MEFLTDYFSLTNLFYLIGLILAGSLTLISTRYRKIMKELVDVAKTLERANADKKVTNAEKKMIMKEVLDVVKAVIGLKWNVFK
jgi:hypothetical protein|tara:strand:- start:3784 stop:4035 length:252 start_codon:yes stop_codon:yes gene_type:complete